MLLRVALPLIAFIQIIVIMVTLTMFNKIDIDNLKLMLSIISLTINTIMTIVFAFRVLRVIFDYNEDDRDEPEVRPSNIADWERNLIDEDVLKDIMSLPSLPSCFPGCSRNTTTEPTILVKKSELTTGNVWDILDNEKKDDLNKQLVHFITKTLRSGERNFRNSWNIR